MHEGFGLADEFGDYFGRLLSGVYSSDRLTRIQGLRCDRPIVIRCRPPGLHRHRR